LIAKFRFRLMLRYCDREPHSRCENDNVRFLVRSLRRPVHDSATISGPINRDVPVAIPPPDSLAAALRVDAAGAAGFHRNVTSRTNSDSLRVRSRILSFRGEFRSELCWRRDPAGLPIDASSARSRTPCRIARRNVTMHVMVLPVFVGLAA